MLIKYLLFLALTCVLCTGCGGGTDADLDVGAGAESDADDGVNSDIDDDAGSDADDSANSDIGDDAGSDVDDGADSGNQDNAFTASRPSLDLEAGAYDRDQILEISVSSDIDVARILYTLNGDSPLEGGVEYNVPIPLVGPDNNYLVKAVAISSEEKVSQLVSAQYSIKYPQAASPSFSLSGGRYIGEQQLQLTHEGDNSEIFYTLDGSAPSANSELYLHPISLSEVGTIEVKAAALTSKTIISEIVSEVYTIFPEKQNEYSLSLDLQHDDSVHREIFEIANSQDAPLNLQINKVTNLGYQVSSEASLTQNKVHPNRQKSFDFDNVVPGEIIVKVKGLGNASDFAKNKVKSLENQRLSDVFKNAGITESKLLSKINEPKVTGSVRGKRSFSKEEFIYLVKLEDSSEQSFHDALDTLNNHPNVVYAEPNFKVKLNQLLPDDPGFSWLYGLNNVGQTIAEEPGVSDADIDAPEAWALSGHTGNKSVRIGIIDTGIDYFHPDLVDNIWVNTGEIPGNNIDDDANGYIDDVHGYDVLDDDGDPFDDVFLNILRAGHGTHVAGTIAAKGNNGLGISGVMWDAELVAIRWSGRDSSTAHAIAAVEYANTVGVSIINASWGVEGYSQALKDVIEEGDSLFIAAPGNDTQNTDEFPSYPASYDSDNILSIAALNNRDELASFSNWGPNSVDIAAPGVDIFSTLPTDDITYGIKSGTSMAAPHVTGVAGLVLSYAPHLSTSDLKRILIESVDPIPALQGRVSTGGRINAFKALSAITPSWLTVSLDKENIQAYENAVLNIDIDQSQIIAGEYAFLVELSTDDPDRPVIEIHLELNIEPCQRLTFNSLTLDFGEVQRGRLKNQRLKIQNTCNSPVKISLPDSDGTLGNFKVSGLSATSIPPFQYGFLDVNFEADFNAEIGAFSFPITMTTDIAEGNSVDLTYRGQIYNGPSLDISNNNLSFVMSQNERQDINVHLSNIGDRPLRWASSLSHQGFNTIVQRGLTSNEFKWQDISNTGTRLDMSDEVDAYESLDFNQAFPFSGNVYSRAFISNHGVLSFDKGTTVYENEMLPASTAPAESIFAYWDDVRGEVYVQEDTEGYTLQFHDVKHEELPDTELTYQIRLYWNGEVVVKYFSLTGTLDSATIGYQVSSHHKTLAHNVSFVEENMQVTFVPMVDWIDAYAEEGDIDVGATTTFALSLSSHGLSPGVYSYQIPIESNDGREKYQYIPLQVIVE